MANRIPNFSFHLMTNWLPKCSLHLMTNSIPNCEDPLIFSHEGNKLIQSPGKLIDIDIGSKMGKTWSVLILGNARKLTGHWRNSLFSPGGKTWTYWHLLQQFPNVPSVSKVKLWVGPVTLKIDGLVYFKKGSVPKTVEMWRLSIWLGILW